MASRRQTKNRKGRARSQQGGVSSVFIVIFTLICLCIASFGYDIGHNVNVRSQLQSAADAAALAGSYDLCLSGGNGDSTPTPTMAQSYATLANIDAAAVCKANYADGGQIQAADITCYPNQFSTPKLTPRNGYNEKYFMTVVLQRKIFNLFATLYGHPFDNIRVVAVAGPIGDPTDPNTATSPYPLAIYQGSEGVGTRTLTQEAGTNTLSVGLLPLLSNNSNMQFVSGPTGLLGGTLAVVGAGGNANPTLQQMRAFDPSQSTCNAPPSCHKGQCLMLLNPGLTGLNLTLLQAGPLTVEDYFQDGNLNSSCFGLTAPSPKYWPQLATHLQGKTFSVPVVCPPSCSILSMPLASILKGGTSAQVKKFVQVNFNSANAKPGTGLSLLGITVIPPDFQVSATVQSINNNTAVPINVGLAL